MASSDRGASFRVHLEGVLAEAVRRAGPQLACRLGCTECCIGPFPISRLDAEWLATGLAELEKTDPARAAEVRRRANHDVAALSATFPGDAATGVFGDDEDARDAFAEQHAARPCPALDPMTGGCDLYAWRPVPCRTFGPPSRDALGDAPPCRLCFVDASTEDLERCRVVFDADGVEEPLVAEAEDAAGVAGDTIVAWALGRPSEPSK